MDKTAIIYSKEEALAMEPAKRPLCFRVPSKIYHDTFEAIGAASLCWSPKPSTEVFDAILAERVAVEFLFKIAKQLESMGMVYEKWPDALKG